MSKVDRFWSHEARNIRCVREGDYDALLEENKLLSATQYGSGRMQALRDERDALLAERDAILLQAQIWAGEAKTQKATVDEVGKILGGVPDWGPIAAGVGQLKKDAERYRWLRDMSLHVGVEAPAVAMADAFASNIQGDLLAGDRLDSAIDAALQGEQPCT